MFYKVKQGNTVIDVLNDPLYVKYQQGNDLCVITTFKTEAFGVISSDGSEIYAVEGFRIVPSKGYIEVTLTPIDEQEYNELREELDDGEQPDEGGEPDPEPDEEQSMSLPKMRTAILDLQSQNEALQSQSDLLTECILEMSELLYV